MCGRDYDRGSGTATGREVHIERMHPLLRKPPVVGWQVYGDLTPAEVERRKARGETCGLGLVMKVGDDRYLGYDLSGGP